MSRFIKNILWFLVFAAVFYAVALVFWKENLPKRLSPNIKYKIGAYGHMHSRMVEAKQYGNADSLDVLFLGSSHAYRGFDTRVFRESGINSFNLGSSSQTPYQTNMLLNRYLNKLNPKLIVYEVYPATIGSDGVESSVDVISNDRNDINSCIMAFQVNHIMTLNTLIYASYRDIFNLNAGFIEPIVKRTDTYVQGGFVEKELKYFSPKAMEEEVIDLNQNQLRIFVSIITNIKKRGIDVLLVYAPIPRVNYSRFSNNQYFDSLMSTYGDYYNFNELMNLDDSLHFYDSHHLNQRGVEMFNQMLIGILNHDTISNHHSSICNSGLNEF